MPRALLAALMVLALVPLAAVAAPAARQTTDVAIVSLDLESGNRVAGACYIIVDASIEGCDENGDGQVDFAAVTNGQFVVTQTRALVDYLVVDDFEIEIVDNGSVAFTVELERGRTGSNNGDNPPARAATADIAIVSADIETGERVAGACYIINDASIEGCDENGDGQVDFEDVAVGRFKVTQTRAPAGYLPVGDFPIEIDRGGAAIFAAFVAEETGGRATVDIAVEALDPFANRVVPGACFLLYGGSIEGCDENGDGQVEFEDVPVGTYLVTETRAPANYGVPDDAWFAVTATGATTLVMLQVPRQGLPDRPRPSDLEQGRSQGRPVIVLPAPVEGGGRGTDEASGTPVAEE
jgi:uncharacterized surface anchored protein